MTRKRFKIFFLFRKIWHDLRQCIIKLQRTFRTMQVRKIVFKVIEMLKSNYTILYYKYDEPFQKKIKPRTVAIRVKMDKCDSSWKIMEFCYNKILKCFLLFLKKDFDYDDHYLFTFVINDNDVIEMNFPTEIGPDGKLYNVLNFEHLKLNGYITNIKSDKYLSMPKRKLTCPDFVHKYSDKCINNSQLKPILKRGSDLGISTKFNIKKVSFDLTQC
jgi:hypothetical protein